MKRILSVRILFPLVGLFFLFAASNTFAADRTVKLLLSVDKTNYEKVEQLIKDLGGKVNRKHALVNVMAVTIPVEKVSQLSSRPEIKRTEKDIKLSIPKLNELEREGFGVIPSVISQKIKSSAPLNIDELKKDLPTIKDNYYYTNSLTNTFPFYSNIGHYGEGIVVGILDGGVSEASAAVGSRIVGGENFTGDGVPATSPANSDHGTWVACCVGANIIFSFGNTAIAEAVERYAPGSVVTLSNGDAGIPMLGQAPLTQFYAFKVLDVEGNGYTSDLAAALERAIELKQQFDNGNGGVNIRVLNISLGFPTLYAGNTYAELMNMVRAAGILVVASAGNAGPSSLTLGFPGDTRNIITAGATSDAVHERIIADLFFGGGVTPGLGLQWRPLNNNLMEYYSSRGPLPSGRRDPDMVAPGSYRYCEDASGTGISWVSGTSFSAPTIAGAAALLLSAFPQATPEQIRTALMAGARKNVLDGNPTVYDQGYGFLDVMNAYQKLTSHAFVLPDLEIGTPFVRANIDLLPGIDVITRKNFTGSTGLLRPGQRSEFYYQIPRNAREVTVTISGITPQLPPSGQNQLFGDDIMVAIHSAKTTRLEDYRAGTPDYVKSGSITYTLTEADLDMGIMRVTVLGDWTNAGAISADVSIQADYQRLSIPYAMSWIAERETKTYSFNVPAASNALELDLFWSRGWEAYPTNDLDMLVYDPNGKLITVDNDLDQDLDGISWDAPERLSLQNPAAGKWTIAVDGYTVWNNRDLFELYARTSAAPLLAKDGQTTDVKAIPADFAIAQNYPNPFNPVTSIKYDIPFDSRVSIVIYNAIGEAVRTLVNESVSAGYHSIIFDGKSDNGSPLASGMYIYRINAGNFSRSLKMMLVK